MTLDQHFLRVFCKTKNKFRNNYIMQIMNVQLGIVSTKKTSQKSESVWFGLDWRNSQVSRGQSVTARDGQSTGANHVSVYLPVCPSLSLFAAADTGTATAGCALSIVLQGGGSPVSAPGPMHVHAGDRKVATHLDMLTC